MPVTIRPIIVSADLDRLLAFYTGLFGAKEVMRFPDDGPVFYVGLTLGDSELGLSSDASVVAGDPGRMLLSIEVPDVDAMLPPVEELGGTARAAPTTCRGAAGRPHQGPGRKRRQPDPDAVTSTPQFRHTPGVPHAAPGSGPHDRAPSRPVRYPGRGERPLTDRATLPARATGARRCPAPTTPTSDQERGKAVKPGN